MTNPYVWPAAPPTFASVDNAYLSSVDLDLSPGDAGEDWSSLLAEYIDYISEHSIPHAGSVIAAFRNSRGGLSSDHFHQLESLSQSQIVVAKSVYKTGKYKDLPEITVQDLPMKRRVTQPRFKLNYETVKDFNLRLGNSIIHVGQLPYYVREIAQGKDDIILIVEDEKKVRGKIPFNATSAIDLRTPEPQYLTLDSWTVRLIRPPLRQQVQGLHHSNSFIERVGGNDGLRNWDDPYELLWALKEGTNVIQWDNETKSLMLKYRALKTLRLSSNIAVLRVGDDLQVHYKGRELGELRDRSIRVDELDACQPWIKRDVQEVNLSMETD